MKGRINSPEWKDTLFNLYSQQPYNSKKHQLLSISQICLSHILILTFMQGYQKTQLALYTYFRSSTAWRVRILLHLKKLAVDYKFVHLVKGEQKNQEYIKINPNGAVPTLALPNGEILVESMAICEYLEEVYPEHPTLPKDPIKKAQVRGFCQVVNSGMHPYQNLRLLQKVGTEFNADKVKFAAYWVSRGMKVFQQLLAKSKGKYCFGDQVTLADAFFYPQVTGGIARFGINIEEYPHSKHVLENLKQIEAFKLSEPKNQPDFEA